MVMGALRGAALLGAGALLCSVRVAHGAQAAARMAFASTAPELLHPGSPAAKLRASQVGTAVARVVSADARGEGGVHGGDLPSGNIFHMPQVNVLFFVDGVPIYGLPSTPFLQELLGAANKNKAHDVLGGGGHVSQDAGSVLTVALGPSFTLVPHLCLSPDSALLSTYACSSSPSGEPFSGSLDDALAFLGVAKGDDDVFEGAADAAVGRDISILAALPQLISQARANSAGPEPALTIVHLPSLTAASAGRARLVDAALQASLAKIEETGLRVTSQIIAGPVLEARFPIAARGSRLLQTTTNSSANVTLDDITQYQLNLWTGFFLAVIVLVAVMMVGCMDIGRDSLLYAKFQADTSGLKVD